jgi:arylsulfatase A-like enzyme
VSGYDVARDPTVPFWRGSKKPGAPLDDRYLDADLAADLLRAVRQERDTRFALFVWFYETHAPYYDGPGPEAWDEAHFPAAVRGNADKEKEFRLYLKALWRIDRYIGELYDELERLGLAEDTVIAVTGDHGEAFGEHGFFGHGEGVYEEEVRVPLILISPSLAPLGQRSRVLGSHVDLWATLTDLCGLPFDPRWQGRSLVSGGEEDRRAYFYRFEKAIGVREGKYKYIWDFREDRHLLFDLESDPAEKHDLAPAMPDYCARLHRRLKTWTAFQRQLTREHLAGK